MNALTGLDRLVAPLRPRIADFPGSRIREVSLAGAAIPDLIALWFGEGDRVTPRFIGEAAVEALRSGHTFYTPNQGITELRAAIAEYVTRLHGRPVDIERVSATASGVNAIMEVLQLLVDPGDNVVFAVPLWPNCADGVHALSGEARRVALTPGEHGWTLDLERLFAACDTRTRAIFLNSPGNPTGWLMPIEQIRAVVEFSRRRRIWVIADEVYERIVYDRLVAPSFLDVATPDDPVIVVNSFSKTWSMTGWRLGWVVAPAALGDALGKVIEFNVSSPTSFVQWGAIAALTQGEGFVEEIVGQYRAARDLVMARLPAMRRVRLAPIEAAFYAFFQVDGMADSLGFAKGLLGKARVGLAPGVAFGPEGEGWLRLCFAVSKPRLEAALDRLAPHLS
jgi:aspartate/methionine/tyrosine aminotransferase